MNTSDIIDHLRSSHSFLLDLEKKYSFLAIDVDYRRARLNIYKSLNSLIQSERGMMTAEEVREFNQTMEAMRKGGI